MRTFRGENEDEMAAAHRRHAAQNAADHRRDRAESEEMWIQTERARKMERRGPPGLWRFEEILNSSGRLTGWTVSLDGKRAGMLVLRGDDILVFSSADNPEDPDATDIMAAFIKLYPDPHARRQLPEGRRQLVDVNPFGPTGRDWSEE